jgi:hypothetical protein
MFVYGYQGSIREKRLLAIQKARARNAARADEGANAPTMWP